MSGFLGANETLTRERVKEIFREKQYSYLEQKVELLEVRDDSLLLKISFLLEYKNRMITIEEKEPIAVPFKDFKVEDWGDGVSKSPISNKPPALRGSPVRPSCNQQRFVRIIHHRDSVRLSRNRNSEYLPQRRKGRKVRRLRVKIIYKSFCPFPMTLAPLRLGGRNSRLRVLSMPDYLRRPCKFLTIVIQRIFYSHSRRPLCVVITLVRDAIISTSCARYLIHYPMN